MIASAQPVNSLLSSEFIFMVSLFFVRYPYHVGKTTQRGFFFMIGIAEHWACAIRRHYSVSMGLSKLFSGCTPAVCGAVFPALASVAWAGSSIW